MTRFFNFCTITIIFLIFSSCSNDSGTQLLIADKLETMYGKEMIRDLLIKNDNNIDQLSRIFECSPSSLSRIMHGETIATDEAEHQFKNVLTVTLITKEKTLDDLDPKYQSWRAKLEHLIESNYILLAIIIFVIIVVGFLCPSTDDGIFWGPTKSYPLVGVGIGLLIFVLLIYFIVLMIGWFSTETIYVDNFKNNYDPIWEMLK